jgi:general secretion pathway protein D
VLNIEQGIGNAAAGTATGSLTPTISQRRVKSSISVNSGQTVQLAGLIDETESQQRRGIALLDWNGRLVGIGLPVPEVDPPKATRRPT